MREEVGELGNALADSVRPVDSGSADPTTGPVVLLAFTSAKVVLRSNRNNIFMEKYDSHPFVFVLTHR